MDTVGSINKLRHETSYNELLKLYEEKIGPAPPRAHRLVLWNVVSRYLDIEHRKSVGKPITERLKQNYEKALKCKTFEDLVRVGLELTMIQKYPEGQITSECPSFRRGWDPDFDECKQCQDHFPEEYEACKLYCKGKEKRKKTMEEKPTTDAIKEEEKPETEERVYPFKGFREGSRAEYILVCIQEAKITFDELAELVADEFKLTKADAKLTVTSYVKEWAQGAWGGKIRKFPFKIMIVGDVVSYDLLVQSGTEEKE